MKTEMQELTSEELMQIEGGKSFWERVGEGVGWVAGKAHNAYDALMELDAKLGEDFL
jgi:bacteriocin-like protein